MAHLSDEQLEEILQGGPQGEHVGQCPLCSRRLAELRAIRDRLQSAFQTVSAGPALAESIRHSLDRKKPRALQARGVRTMRLLRWALPLTAAAVLLIGTVVLLIVSEPEQASAATAELYQVHQHNLSPHAELFADPDPESLAGFLKDRLGFSPALPRLGAGMSLRGCCIVHFRDKPVGSYVVDTPSGVISVIVVTETPKSLGMNKQLRRGGHTYQAGSFAKCNMVTTQLNGYTYCAVGEVPHELLADLLEQLVW